MGAKLYKEPREKKHENFGKKLKEARKLKYKYQQEFADAIGAKVETVRNWEQGWYLPEMGTLFKICDTLDCDIDYLIGRLEERNRTIKEMAAYTGLSEDAVKALHKYNNANDRRSSWPSHLSDIITHKDFFALMSNISDYMGTAKLERLITDDSDEVKALDMKAAGLFYISHTLTNIIDEIADKYRERSHERSKK